MSSATTQNENWGFKPEKGRGPAFQTVSGTLFFILDPKPEDVSIYDIAHNLSMQCRYNGALPQFYSVAQHCVYVAEYMEARGIRNRRCLKALLHDSHEAYIGDIVTPLKVVLPDYQQIEQKIDNAIFDKFDVPRGFDKMIKEADKAVFATEVRDLRGEHGYIPYPAAPKIMEPIPDIKIEPVDSKTAMNQFLQKYVQYTGQ